MNKYLEKIASAKLRAIARNMTGDDMVSIGSDIKGHYDNAKTLHGKYKTHKSKTIKQMKGTKR